MAKDRVLMAYHRRSVSTVYTAGGQVARIRSLVLIEVDDFLERGQQRIGLRLDQVGVLWARKSPVVMTLLHAPARDDVQFARLSVLANT